MYDNQKSGSHIASHVQAAVIKVTFISYLYIKS